ncbi:MAG: GEVED domain-containing protein [Bacteroidota bacterium]|nr:GEVED domain-containing protein [Bacteroidota bacterium]
MMRIAVLLLLLCLWGGTQAQQAVYNEVIKSKSEGRSFQKTQLLTFSSNDVANRDLNLEGLKKGSLLNLDQAAIQQLIKSDNEYLELSLPVSDRSSLNLILVKHNIFAPDFSLYTSNTPNTPVDYNQGLHYMGIVDGDPTSLVAISVFNDEIMGLISTHQGNLVLGRIQADRETRHILYNDADLNRESGFECGTSDEGLPYTAEDLKPNSVSRDAGDCVRVYIEIDDDIVTQKGGATPATNYITGLFNQSFILYTNEQVNMTISEIKAWITPSPYTGSTASAMLNSFTANTGNINGNIGHLVSYKASGGIAYLDGLCQTNHDYRKCFSSIASTFSNVPTYSWSVMVVTHEMGHVVGSKHTHACAWNGNNTAIDGCAGSVEGSCPLPPNPSGGGTMMSYCHLNVGINFNLGFGPQPGNVLRNRVNATGNCLTACGPPPPPPPPAYCTSNGTNSSFEYINKVLLGSINNTSGNNAGYGNYTALTTNLTKGTAYSIQLTPGFASGVHVEYWKVFIDYNGDLDWSDAGETVGQGSGTGVVNITFTVPATNATLATRMRVSMQYNAFPPTCGSFTYGEVEDYIVNIVASSGQSCTDGIQNQGETGIDCGGPCAPCPTCNDGIQNQGETGVDCGGPCSPCPPPPPPPPGGGTTLLASYFETGWDGWLDGGSDVARVISSNSYEGQYSIRIADNSTTQSAMTSPTFNLATGAVGLQITFYFYAWSMESGEDFQLKYNNGSGWVTVGSYIRGIHFNNNTFYTTTVTIPNFVPTGAATLRIQCDASDDNDQVFIDAVTITKLTGTALIEAGMTIEELNGPFAIGTESSLANPDVEKELMVYPNPVQDFLNLSLDGDVSSVRVVGIDGRELKVTAANHNNKLIDISFLNPGIYFTWVESGGKWYPSKFTKM